MNTPESARELLHYANAHPTEATWRRSVLGPAAKLVLRRHESPPEVPTYGVRSLAELNPILEEFRQVMAQWVNLESVYSAEAEQLLQTTIDRSNLVFDGWFLGADSGQLVEKWDTGQKTFAEYLYSKLLLALRESPYRCFHRCEACGKFFYDPSQRRVKYCSKTCLNRTMVKRFRERAATPERATTPPDVRRSRTTSGGSRKRP